MEKYEKQMKRIIEQNYSKEIEGMQVADLIEGTITAEKRGGEFTIDFRETGYKKRGSIFIDTCIAPFYNKLFLQLFPARFDMILRVAGSMFVKRLNELDIDREKIVISVQHCIGVEDDLPISCPEIQLEGWKSEDMEPFEEAFCDLAEIIAENLALLTDTFLFELKGIVKKHG